MELVPRTTAPLHATGAVEFVLLAAVSADATFRLREAGDVAALAGSIARLGQLSPVELRPLPGAGDGPVRWQVVAGFRRLAAVRLLGRGRVLARVHGRLDEDDAWSLALTGALLGEPLPVAALEALRQRLSQGRAAPWAEELIDAALARAAQDLAAAGDDGGAAEDAASSAAEQVDEAGPGAPPAGATGAADDEEVTLEELAAGLATRLAQVNLDLSLAVDAWDELPGDARRMILEQARYLAELHPYLSRGAAR